MNITQMTKELHERGYSQRALAEWVNNYGVACSQPTIYRILHGTDPGWSLGFAICRMYAEEFGVDYTVDIFSQAV